MQSAPTFAKPGMDAAWNESMMGPGSVQASWWDDGMREENTYLREDQGKNVHGSNSTGGQRVAAAVARDN